MSCRICEHIDIDRMVMESHYMESLERGSSSSLSDMERQDYENQISGLKETIRTLQSMIKTLQLTIESLNASNSRNEKQNQELASEIVALRKIIADLTDRDRRHNKNTYGKKSRKSGGHTHENADRTKEKDDYDGSHTDTPSEQKTDEPVAEDGLDMSKVKSEHLDGERGPRGPYSRMDAARVTTLLCDITNIPEGMKFVCFKEADAIQFRNWISYLYMVENENILRGRTPEEIKQRRAQKDVTDTLVKLHTHAERLLRTKGDKYSSLMVKALKYMLNGWDELLNYRKDGHYTIDNLPAERAIRPVTVARKNSLHYSSEEGLEVALTYMTIIETAKMWGMNAKDFLVRAWREIIYGNNDIESLFQAVPVRR